MEVTAKKERHLSFGKVFLASLLAVVAGSVVSGLFWLGIFSSISSLMQSEVVTVPEQAVLRIDLAENLVDAPSRNPMSQLDLMTMSMGSELTLYDAVRAIEAAQYDDRIEGIYINLAGMGSAEVAAFEELRQAILDFKAASGKFVVAYNSIYSQWGYYLATAADRIYIEPEGSFEWAGLTMGTLFYKGLMDKLGIEMTILRPSACKYKSAVEPFIRTDMSPENREQMQSLADNMWGVVTEAVASSRGIDSAELNRLADNLEVMLPQEAEEYGFVDGLMYADEVMESMEEEYGLDTVEFVSLGDYASTIAYDVNNLTAPKVAIVYAGGMVLDGSGPDDNIYADDFSQTLQRAIDDDDIAAVVVRVNSPGGSALAADIIWRKMELLREKKPVIISMGQTAASGGYYISAPADAIVADRTTLTGSIGVYGQLPAFGKALKDKLGITYDAVNTNRYSNVGSGMEPLKDAEYAAVMRSVDRVYARFTALVAQGRNLPIEKVLDLAGGRVWSGAQAQEIGLVDTCGGLKAAIAVAIDKAGLGDNYRIVELTDEMTGLMAMLRSLNVSVREKITARSELGDLYREYSRIESMVGRRGVYAMMPEVFRFGDR